jgi:hypothetical protein
MFQNVEIAFLGASSVSSKTGVILWEPSVPVTDGDQDIEPFGPTAVYQGLGFASMPYQKTAEGYAECIVIRHCGGRNAVCIGGRDTRTARVVGNMKPGDTVVHSTGPNQAAQLQLKEEKFQAVLTTKNKTDSKTMAVILDGATGKIQITAHGALIEIDPDGDLSLLNKSGSGILIQGSDVFVVGTLRAGKGVGPFSSFMLGPATGSPGGTLSVPLVACQAMSAG